MKTKIISGLAVFMTLMLVMSTPAAAVNISDLSEFQQLDSHSHGGDGQAIAVDSSGNYYYGDGDTVYSYDKDGNFRWSTTPNSGNTVESIEVDDNGDNVYIAVDGSASEVFKRDASDGSASGVFTFADSSAIRDMVYYENQDRLVVLKADILQIIDVSGMSSHATDSLSLGNGARSIAVDQSTGNIFMGVGSTSESSFIREYDQSASSQGGISIGTTQYVRDIELNETSGDVFLAIGQNIKRFDQALTTEEQSRSLSSAVTGVELFGDDVLYMERGTAYHLSPQSDLSNDLDTVSTGERANPADSNGRFYARNDQYNTETAALYQVKNPVTAQSLDVSISGNTTQYNTTGTDNFEVNATVTYSNGSTAEVSEDIDTSYIYNTTQLNQLTPKDTFEGKNSGTDSLTAEFTGPEGNVVSDSITVKVEDPPDVQSIELTGLPSDMPKGAENQLTATVTYQNGTTQVVTDSSSYSSSDVSVVSVNSTGYTTAQGAGTASVQVSYTDSWSGTTVTDSQSTQVRVIDRVEFNVSNTNPRKYENVTMSATLYWSDGTTTNLDNTITAANVTSSKPARTNFTFSEKKVKFSDDTNLTLTYSATYKGVVITDTEDVSVKPCICFEDYNKLSGPSQMFLFFTDWSLWAILASILVGGMVGLKFGGGSGIAATTMMLAMAWVAGLVSIFIPATLILFEIFIMVVLDVQMVDFN